MTIDIPAIALEFPVFQLKLNAQYQVVVDHSLLSSVGEVDLCWDQQQRGVVKSLTG